MSKNNFFTRFAPPPSKAEDTSKPSMAEQQFGFECDINNLVTTIVDKNGRQHAQLTHVGTTTDVNNQEPIYGDFTQFTSDKLMEGLNIVTKAKQMFSELPSSIRNRFDNSPSKLIDFVNNPDNYEEGFKLGLFKERLNKITPEVSTTPEIVKPAPEVVTPPSVAE